ncbi:Vacuolar protein sorting-associated protein 13C [Armadillidium nasatum]|uniref:Vacuolar protein sorting-associated protein 13C n=1 Tax=Armadillidium nasatum TaxID=96803 RepID=A0A5N5SKD5_9CRUS|nr:Vacuolar protein sorting-associated protein 13C [Armadillidium nasatum]
MYMQESDKNGLWFDIGPNQCEAFWPTCEELFLVVRRRESQTISQRFHFNTNHTTVLRMEKGTALFVSVDGVGSDCPVVVTFSKYETGDAPIRLENGCDISLRFHQRNSSQVTVLAPQQSMLYTWDDPTLERELLWNIYGRKSKDFTAVINMDKRGSETVPLKSKDKKEKDENSRTDILIHWVCYKEKNQRVLLFTQSKPVANLFGKPKSCAHTEIIVSLESIGVSLNSLSGYIVNV